MEKPWYYVASGGSQRLCTGRIRRVLNNQPGYETDADFEAYLNAQGFPESYKPYLRSLHAQYPNWKFRAAKTGLSWSSVPGRREQARQVAGAVIFDFFLEIQGGRRL